VEDRSLVLELVDGPTLADRIAKGSIPLDEALPIARQIAKLSGYQLKGLQEAGAYADRAEVTAVSREYAVHLASFRYGRNRTVDKTQAQTFELGVEFQGANHV
jgi:hypothetical protein